MSGFARMEIKGCKIDMMLMSDSVMPMLRACRLKNGNSINAPVLIYHSLLLSAGAGFTCKNILLTKGVQKVCYFNRNHLPIDDQFRQLDFPISWSIHDDVGVLILVKSFKQLNNFFNSNMANGVSEIN